MIGRLQRQGRRARVGFVARPVVGCVGTIALSLASVVASSAASNAAAFAADASNQVSTTYIGAPTNNMQFTVRNLGSLNTIGAVRIERPDASWTITGCAGPKGWALASSSASCEWTSAVGSSDDIPIGGRDLFYVSVGASAASGNDVVGSFPVTVSKAEDLAPGNTSPAAARTPGALTLTAHVFSINRVVLVNGPIIIGSVCPATSQTATAGSVRSMVVCGANHSSLSLTPTAASSSVQPGNFVQAPGSFSSALVTPGANKVLANVTGNKIAAVVGGDKVLNVQIGASPAQTSRVSQLKFFIVDPNNPPVGVDDAGSGFITDEATPFTTGNVLANDTDPDLGQTFSVGSFDTAGTLGLVTSNGNGTFTYDPNGAFDALTAGQKMSDTFTYTLSDGAGGTATATVTITVMGLG